MLLFFQLLSLFNPDHFQFLLTLLPLQLSLKQLLLLKIIAVWQHKPLLLHSLEFFSHSLFLGPFQLPLYLSLFFFAASLLFVLLQLQFLLSLVLKLFQLQLLFPLSEGLLLLAVHLELEAVELLLDLGNGVLLDAYLLLLFSRVEEGVRFLFVEL
jgi:hypothetical protein